MATDFPENLDNFTNPDSNNPLSNPSHSEQHANANDAIEALQAKVGIDGSTDPNSLDNRIAQLESESGSDIANKLGLEGNNDLEVTGIENPTVIDSFDSTAWTTASYRVQIKKDNLQASSNVTAIYIDGSIYMSEYDVVSNTDTVLANLEFTKTGSIINLLVTPLVSPIIVRYYRTALKN